MTTISDKDRAEAQAMREAFFHDLVTPYALSDSDVRRWLAVRDHVLAAHECPSLPAWRPTTADEIQPGWEIRSRRRNGSEAGWGVAHHQDEDGDWHTEAGAMLTYEYVSWTYETTAPLPEPEPWPDEVVESLVKTLSVGQDPIAVLDALAALRPGVRAAITGGEQS